MNLYEIRLDVETPDGTAEATLRMYVRGKTLAAAIRVAVVRHASALTLERARAVVVRARLLTRSEVVELSRDTIY